MRNQKTNNGGCERVYSGLPGQGKLEPCPFPPPFSSEAFMEELRQIVEDEQVFAANNYRGDYRKGYLQALLLIETFLNNKEADKRPCDNYPSLQYAIERGE